MKRQILLTVVVLLIATLAFAQDFKPYGSARLGFWYDLPNEDYTGTGESDFDLNYGLQSNSRFGVDFNKSDLTAKVEYGTGVNLRLLWAKLDLDGYSLLIGQDYDGTNEYAAQVYGNDNGLIGYGAVDGGRHPMVKVEMDNGFYFSLIQPTCYGLQSLPTANSYDILIPKINVGYKMKADNFYVHPTLMLQHYSYSKDENIGNTDDASVFSWLFAVTGQMNMDELLLRGQLNYGQNTANMGYANGGNAYWNAADKEVNSTGTLGLFGEIGYKLSDVTTIDGGLGFNSNSNDAYDDSNSNMALYLQAKTMLFEKLQLVPEIGMLNDMEDGMGNKEGSKLYFGTQLRMDF